MFRLSKWEEVLNLKTLCFRFFGDFGHFKPFFTTTSPITYSLIPPTAVFGVLGAILGLDKSNYTQILYKAGTRVGVGNGNSITKKSMGINLINTKGDYWIPTSKNSSGPRTPTRYEFLVNPEYLIFVTMSDSELLDCLALKIKRHETYYSVSMGLAWLLADFELVEFNYAREIINCSDFLSFSTAVPLTFLDPDTGVGIKPGIRYCKERFVKSFTENRKPNDYVDALFSTSKEKASLKVSEAYCLKDYYFCFLN